MPAVFQRSVFHSSSHLYPVFVSMSNIRGAPSISHLPYTRSIPRVFMLFMDWANSGIVGVRGSTSTAACNVISILHNSGKRISYRGSIEWADKSIAITILSGGDGCFGLDYGIDTSHWTMSKCRSKVTKGQTSIGCFSRDLEKHMVLDVSLGRVRILHDSVALRAGNVRHTGERILQGGSEGAMLQWLCKCDSAHNPLSAEVVREVVEES